MKRLALIVEGHGEVEALPILMQRIAEAAVPGSMFEIVRPPHRLTRGKMVKQHEITRAVELQARKVGHGGAVLVLLDADKDCPAKVGPQLRRWVARRSDIAISVVVAKREYEAWFLAAARSLSGKRGLPEGLEPPTRDPEEIANPKAWLTERMGSRYTETRDQAALTSAMSLREAREAPSFDKLWRDTTALLGSS